ncbi:MAG TPA: glycosyltransferase [Gemmatimonadaceae bacterium]|nr:glycosyltransferase [Gemmatimonadaceae bacterium]
MRAWLGGAIEIFDAGILLYFLAINTLYLVFSIVSFFLLIDHRRRWTSVRFGAVMQSPATPGISIIAPAHNEEASIAHSVRALLLVNYPQFEVIVVNDASTDGTLRTLMAEFELMRAPGAYQQSIQTRPVRGTYRALDNPDLVVIDKENGGKADAVNAGINAARHPLVCVIDADSLLEPQALLHAALPFVEDPDTLAAGGIVRIANGCRVEAGRVTQIDLPKSWLARFQVIEYLRAFLSGRVAMSAANAMLIISGAFGVFRRDAVIEVGGFRDDTIGEDMEIVARLHRHWRNSGRRYRIVFQPEPVCWTEVPETFAILRNQRNRWQRGTCQVLGFHAGMIGNPRYGAVGLFAMPFFLIFEAAGPLIEVAGYVVTIVAVWLGVIDRVFAELVFLTAVVFGALISIAAVLLEEVSFRRYPKVSQLLAMAALGVIENFGYRQLTSWWRLVGVVDYLRKKKKWGSMTRRGISTLDS